MTQRDTDSQVLHTIRDRRSTREYLDQPVSKEAIRRIVEAGRLAPSGANRQPWHFVVIDDPKVKHNMRSICEDAETRYYENADEELKAWFAAHSITPHKPFLERAPVLIGVFFDPHGSLRYPLGVDCNCTHAAAGHARRAVFLTLHSLRCSARATTRGSAQLPRCSASPDRVRRAPSMSAATSSLTGSVT